MGLLDKLLKMGADKLVDAVSNSLSGASASSGQNSVKPQKDERYDWEVVRENGKDVWQKLEEIFASHFSDYEVRRDVSPTEIGGVGKFQPYTYGLYLNGEPKAFVMVTGHNQDSKREYRWSKEQAQKEGIPFINFFSHFENKETYIIDRLSRYLKYCG